MKYLKLVVVLTISLMAFACSSSGDNSNKVKTKVPVELSENEAVKEYFSALDEVVNEYVNMIEKMAESSKEAKNSGDEGFGTAMSTLASASGSMMKMAPLLEKMEKLEKEAEVLKGDMSPQEIKAFMESYTKLINRFREASLKINNNNN